MQTSEIEKFWGHSRKKGCEATNVVDKRETSKKWGWKVGNALSCPDQGAESGLYPKHWRGYWKIFKLGSNMTCFAFFRSHIGSCGAKDWRKTSMEDGIPTKKLLKLCRHEITVTGGGCRWRWREMSTLRYVLWSDLIGLTVALGWLWGWLYPQYLLNYLSVSITKLIINRCKNIYSEKNSHRTHFFVSAIGKSFLWVTMALKYALTVWALYLIYFRD